MQTMKHIDEFITEDELKELVKYAKRDRDSTLVTYLFYSVRRISEVVKSLKAEDISLKSDNVRYNILKKGKKCSICGHRIRRLGSLFVCFNREKNAWEHNEGHIPATVKNYVWIREGPLFPESFNNYQFIREYIERNKLDSTEYVFPIGRSMAHKIIREMADKAGITFRNRQMHAHVLRHSGAVYYAKKCENMMQLMKLKNKLQHSSIDMTAYYLEHFKE